MNSAPTTEPRRHLTRQGQPCAASRESNSRNCLMFACDESTNNRTPVGEMSDIMHFRTENPSSGRIQAGEPILRRGALRAPCAIAVTPIVPAALKPPSVNRPSSRVLFYRRKLWAILIRLRKFELLRSQFGNHKFPKLTYGGPPFMREQSRCYSHLRLACRRLHAIATIHLPFGAIG
jgi:hypothetical protein